MRILIPLTLFTVLLACSSRTEYESYEDGEGGYRQKQVEDGLTLVNFVGNEETEKNTALLFAAFRSIETCKAGGKKYSHMLYVSGDIEKEQVVETYPTYYGASPYYGGFGYPGTAFSGGFGAFGGYYGYGSGYYPQTYVDTVKYPEATVVFECANEVFEPQVEFNEVSRKELGFQTADDKGGIKVVSVPQDSPNKTVLKKGDVILKAAGDRVFTVHGLTKALGPNQQTIDVEIMRNNKRLQRTIYTKDVTPMVAKHQQEIIERTCDIEDFEHSYCEDED